MPIVVVTITCFVVGNLLHILNLAGTAMRFNKYPSRTSYLERNWDMLLIRAFFIAVIFAAWDSGNLYAILMHIPWLPVDYIPACNPLTAPVAGYFGDTVLTTIQAKLALKYPSLAREIPVEAQNILATQKHQLELENGKVPTPLMISVPAEVKKVDDTAIVATPSAVAPIVAPVPTK